MKALQTALVMLVALSLALSPGCKEKGEKGEDEKKAGGVVEIPEAPATADGVFKETQKAVADRQPGKVFYMLPESYRKDVQGIKDMVIEGLDKETVDNWLKAFDKVVAGVEKHKDKILEAGLPVPLPKEALGSAIDQIVKLWAALESAGLDSYDGWKALDVGEFLLVHGNAILASVMDVAAKADEENPIGLATGMISMLTMEVKKTGDAETILLIGMDDEEKEELKFVKVEGKWIPEDLLKGWEEGIAEATKEIGEGLKDYAEQKDGLKVMSGMLLAAAGDFEETGDLEALMGALDAPPPAK